MTWLVYLIAIHLLALPGAYMLFGLALTAFLDLTTNVNTGEPKPAARGIGWAVVGGAVVALVCYLH